MSLPTHPAADVFPLMTDQEFRSLKADIKANGQREPIGIVDGQILDGRNRYRACTELGIEPRVEEIKVDDAFQYALSANLHRRHLNAGQRALIAARLLDIEKEKAKERKKRKGKSEAVKLPEQKGDARDIVAKMVGVSGKTVDSAAKVLKFGTPELVLRVEQGLKSVFAAAAEIKSTAVRKRAEFLRRWDQWFDEFYAMVEKSPELDPIYPDGSRPVRHAVEQIRAIKYQHARELFPA